MAKVEYSAVGRRKKAIARVRLVAGDGKIVINKRDLDNYFGLETLKMTVRQPLDVTKAGGDMDILVTVTGITFTLHDRRTSGETAEGGEVSSELRGLSF